MLKFFKKNFLFFTLFIVFFSACTSKNIGEQQQNIYHRWHYEGEYYYFLAPRSLKISDESFEYKNCDFQVGLDMEEEFSCKYDLTDDVTLFFSNENLICCDVLEEIGDSFVDQGVYINEDYSFKLPLRYDFEAEMYENGKGIFMRHFPVVLELFVDEDLESFDTMGDYLKDKYPGYSYEFVNYEYFDGVFVDEGSGDKAKRRFLAFLESGDAVLNVVMTVDRHKYSIYKDFLEEVVKSIEYI